ncbi:unnamed protein product [Lupinus luteus]|uniref:Uncharacterized protein n=1 Tax=Lupinus luteus TaxID=3873 RepID=A0AAV1WA49_LUPLU
MKPSSLFLLSFTSHRIMRSFCHPLRCLWLGAFVLRSIFASALCLNPWHIVVVMKNKNQVLEEIKTTRKISGPTAITGLLSYSRAMISMFFLRYLGEMELAGGSLSIGSANITHYSVIAGLAMGMEPICGQAYRAKQMKILGFTLQRTILLLLSTSFQCHSHGLT